MDENTYGDNIIDQYWCIDGPHNDHTTRQAANAIHSLVRFLCHATGHHRAAGMPGAPTANSVVQNLRGAVGLMPQLFGQLALFLEHQASDPSLYDDRRDPARFPASHTALSVSMALEQAAQAAEHLATSLSTAAKHTVHLGNENPRTLAGLEGEDLG